MAVMMTEDKIDNHPNKDSHHAAFFYRRLAEGGCAKSRGSMGSNDRLSSYRGARVAVHRRKVKCQRIKPPMLIGAIVLPKPRRVIHNLRQLLEAERKPFKSICCMVVDMVLDEGLRVLDHWAS
jgi:hypothetical protein